jgi:coenzyme Q-binding protein COQ10
VFLIARDVKSYREFLPLIKRSAERNHTTLEDGRECFDGELLISYPKLGIQEVMTSRVTVDPRGLRVRAESNQNPVERLVAEWTISPKGDIGCDITFHVDYKLKSRTLQFILSGMFDLAVRKMMNAFEQRARALYGAGAATS